MSKAKNALYDPRLGAEPLQRKDIELRPGAFEPPRTNCFLVYWIATGAGVYFADAESHTFSANSLLFFKPYQYVRFEVSANVCGALIQFHANFLCVETFHAESGCAGALFNDPFQPPQVKLNPAKSAEVTAILEQMRDEFRTRPLAFEEMLLAQLKMLLILATRAKSTLTIECGQNERSVRHPVLATLKQLINEHFASLHAPSDYAKRLHMTPKTLGRIVREQLGKSLTDLIRERILTYAKWQLLHTLKPVKEVAREVGFRDELYFSRMFKRATGFSPKFFREFETEIRGGSNLSMLSLPAPILTRPAQADNSGS